MPNVNIHNVSAEVEFSDLVVGDWFMYHGNVFIKILDDLAHDIKVEENSYFRKDDLVRPIVGRNIEIKIFA